MPSARTQPPVRSSTSGTIRCAGMCGAAALVFAGFFDFVFYNYTVFFTFWVVAGLASAAADIRVREVRARNIEMISAGGDDRAADITISFN